MHEKHAAVHPTRQQFRKGSQKRCAKKEAQMVRQQCTSVHTQAMLAPLPLFEDTHRLGTYWPATNKNQLFVLTADSRKRRNT
jgi:hypothetical protein